MTVSVSVVIACYNARRTLDLCLQAVKRQSHPLHEVIVVDDASTDDSVAIALAGGCTVVRQPVNRGVSAARNRGWRESTGEVVFFVDSDVALAPDAVANAVAILDADPQAAVVHGTYDTEPLIDDGPLERYRLLHAAFWRKRLAGPVRTVVFALAAVRRTLLDEIGGLDERLRDCEDVEFSGRIPLRHRIVLSDRVVGRHDDGFALGQLVREQWRRAVPLVGLARRALHRMERSQHPVAVVSSGLGVAALPLLALGWPWAVLPVVLIGLFVACEPALPRFVLRERGLRFACFFMAVHLLMNAVLVAGLTAGLVLEGRKR
ncbi:glycosyltransferase family 2 protein [Allorhizocola rhizosphaerae]|uniref:glycosyltransferase family 2 protein n=1 Tax=Allorhizocola rhizosphaerae TaxID=1872709 RepID=UPI001B8BF21C|nr:glycosyltransferase [Allorhizocola rhizosphaerae]